jgi:hypothetical protein
MNSKNITIRLIHFFHNIRDVMYWLVTRIINFQEFQSPLLVSWERKDPDPRPHDPGLVEPRDRTTKINTILTGINMIDELQINDTRINSSSVQNIRTCHIDNLDDVNTSGTLEGITFYQEKSDIKSIHNNEPMPGTGTPDPGTRDSGTRDPGTSAPRTIDSGTIPRDPGSQDDNCMNKMDSLIKDREIIGSIVIRKKKLFNINKSNYSDPLPLSRGIEILDNEPLDMDVMELNSSIELTDNTNLIYYSHYFMLDDQDKKIILNVADLIKEIFVIIFLHLFLGIHNAIFNVITIDGIISCAIFYIGFMQVTEKNNFLIKNRLMTLDRYIYYLLLFCGYYLFNYMTWYRFTDITMYVASIMICPSVMGQIYNIYAYKKIRKVLYEGYNRLIRKIICKQLCKIINLIIIKILCLTVRVKYEDLVPFYNKFSWLIINKFIVTFVLACIFNHVDKGGMKFPMMIYKNLYMKDTKYKITDDKLYLEQIIQDKQFAKFLDVYTLNRIIRMLVNDDAQNSMLSEQVTQFLQKLTFRLNRIMMCWTIASFSNLTVGILGFLMFITSTERPLRYIINTLFFVIISLFTVERILIIIMCELFYPIVDSKLLTDVIQDTYQSIKRGFLNLCHRTRLESVMLSGSLSYLSFYEHHNMGIFIVCGLNLIVMICLYRSAYHGIRLPGGNVQSNNSIERNKSRDTNNNIRDRAKKEVTTNKLIQDPVTSLNTPTRVMDCSLNGILEKNEGFIPDVKLGPDPVAPNLITTDKMIKTPTNEEVEAFDIQSDILARNQAKLHPILITSAPRTQVPGTSAPETQVPGTVGYGNASPGTGAQQHDGIQNRDILLILIHRIKIILKNNLLIKVMNPFAKIEIEAIIRISAHLWILLILGYMSNFHVVHIIFLPIIVQNVIDIIF